MYKTKKNGSSIKHKWTVGTSVEPKKYKGMWMTNLRKLNWPATIIDYYRSANDWPTYKLSNGLVLTDKWIQRYEILVENR